jgi:hypothetical protein
MRVMKLEATATVADILDKNRKHSKLWTIMFNGLMVNLVQMTAMMMLAPFFTDLEPSFFVLKLIFGSGTVKTSWAIRILRSFINALLTAHWAICSSSISLFVLGITNLITECLQMMVCLSSKCDYRWRRGRLVIMLVRKLTFVYRHLFILMDVFNTIMRWTVAIALAVGMGVFVLGGSGSVILAGKVNFTTYLLFPLLALTMVIVVNVISQPAEKVDILSLEFLSSFKSNRLEMQPFRVSRSLQPLRFQVGSFYYFKQASALNIMAIWVENCINVLLA